MKRLFRLQSMLLLAALTLFAFSCDKNDDGPAEKNGKNITETAQATDALSSLVGALVQADAGLVAALSDETKTYTVFAPTNEAFASLLGALDGFDSLEDFDTDDEKALLATILKYHVVSGTVAKSTDLSDGQMIATLQEEEVTIGIDGVMVSVKDKQAEDVEAAKVAIADVEANNGVVHVIDKILLPQAVIDAINGEPMEMSQNLVEIVVATDALSILEAAVIKAGLTETLSSEGPFTVFAPTDDAFVALLDILGDDYNSLDDFDTEEEIALLTNILLYHVITPAKILAADLAEGSVETAFSGNSIDVIAADGTFVIGDASDADATITGTDIMASNGVAHTIDKVLLPQSAIDFVASLSAKTIVDLAIETDDLSLLVDALIRADAGLVETLSGDGPFTVFAPTNEAFAGLLDALGDDYNSLSDFDTEEEKTLLTKVLTYHVVAGAALSTDLTNGQLLTTVQGEEIYINIKDGTIHLDDATDTNASVVSADIEASNGVVHVIDKVILPQEVLDLLNPSTPNIVGLAQSVPDLSLLVDALGQADAGLVAVLSGDGPFTVFAPNNAAFADLLDILGEDYNSLADFDTDEEKELLATILTYHVVPDAAVASGDLSDHQRIGTVQGEDVFALLGNGVRIRDRSTVDANVTLADQMASNGIVHVIDKILLPQAAIDALGLPGRH